ncbi:MAG: NADH-quinone oxidoreductase subunit N [Thermoguttaceae bacterium]
MTTATLRLLLPEIMLVAMAVGIYLAGAFWNARRAWNWLAGAALAAAAFALARQTDTTAADGLLNVDALAWLGRWASLGFGVLLLLAASRPLVAGAEYVGSLLLAIAGLMLVASAADLVLLFVALELISIPTYILLYLGRSDAAHQESAAKYFFLSVLSSALLLYGFSFLCGIAGFGKAPGSHAMTALAAVQTAMREGLGGTRGQGVALTTFAKLALVLVFAGLSFRITAVPFHFYAPDVYEGNTHPNAAVLSILPKAAGFVALTRILVDAMPGLGAYAWQLVLVISLLTMSVGNVMALWQNDFRRLLAYSSIAQAGYMLLALAVAMAHGSADEWSGLGALWFYLVAYGLATIGAFAVAESLGAADRRIDAIGELAGLARRRPVAAAVLAICLLSLTGVPPLAGFWGKLLVFGSALNVSGSNVAEQVVNLPSSLGQVANLPHAMRWWFLTAAVIGVLNAAIAAAYYLRVAAVLYFRTPEATHRSEGGRGPWIAAVLCALLLIGIGAYPGPVIEKAAEAGTPQGVAPPEGWALECPVDSPAFSTNH